MEASEGSDQLDVVIVVAAQQVLMSLDTGTSDGKRGTKVYMHVCTCKNIKNVMRMSVLSIDHDDW